MADIDWRDERRSLQRHLVEAEFQRLAAEARAVQAERRLAAAEARAVQAESDAAGLQASLDQVRGSTSWRLTSPIRKAGLLLGKAR